MTRLACSDAPATSAACRGFYGKIPARGDFVRSRLPGVFVTAWDAWLQQVLPASRELLGEDWLPAWLQAPVWRFALDGGICGPDGVLGLWMPSVDRAGRHFPLTLAAIVPGAGARDVVAGAAWLSAAERAGRDAIESDATPEQLAIALDTTPAPESTPGAADAAARSGACDGAARGMSRWWTEGAPRVQPRAMQIAGLPDGAGFAAMLDDRVGR